MELKCELPKYKAKTKFWWEREHPFDEWLDEKYAFCRYEALKAIQDFDGDNKLNGNIYPIILAILSENNCFNSEREFTANDMFKAYQFFVKLVAEINQYYLFIPSKQNFCAFVNITVNIYNDMGVNSTPEMQAVIDMINDYLISSLAHAGQIGAAKASIASLLLKAEEAGAGIMTAKEKTNAEMSKHKLDYDEINKRLKSISETIPDLLGG